MSDVFDQFIESIDNQKNIWYLFYYNSYIYIYGPDSTNNFISYLVFGNNNNNGIRKRMFLQR